MVGRKLNITSEIYAVAEEDLIRTFFISPGEEVFINIQCKRSKTPERAQKPLARIRLDFHRYLQYCARKVLVYVLLHAIRPGRKRKSYLAKTLSSIYPRIASTNWMGVSQIFR